MGVEIENWTEKWKVIRMPPLGKRFDLEKVRSAAMHQWHVILPRVAGIDSSYLSGKHGPCPKCSHDTSDDRWRFTDLGGSGSAICNQCGKNGDGFGTIQWYLGKQFLEVLAMVAEFLGVEPEVNPSNDYTPTEPDKRLVFTETLPPAMALVWCSKKKPIVPQSLTKVRARYATYRKRYPVIALPGFGREGKVTAWVLYHASGKELPIFEKGNKEPSDWVKIKNTSGSRAGWIGTPIDDSIDTIWKVEGPSDLLALVGILPKGHGAVCNIFGAGENPASNPWLLDIFKNKIAFVVHDCDEPGQDGAIGVKNERRSRPGWAPAIANYAKETRNVVLPFPIEKSNGKDLRDWLNLRIADKLDSNDIFLHLHELARRADVVEAIELKETHKSSSDIAGLKMSSSDPDRLAEINLQRYRSAHAGEIAFYRNQWLKYRRGRWQHISDGDIRAKVHSAIRARFELDYIDDLQGWKDSGEEGPPPKVRHVTRPLVSNVLAAMESKCLIPSSIDMPAWLDDRKAKPFIAFENGLLDIDSFRKNEKDYLKPTSHLWFSLAALPYQFDHNARCPDWQQFLNSSLEGDNERISLLQEWCGYLLLGNTRYQKAMILEGNGSNGKTVALAGITAMLGEANISGLSIEDFSNKFALGSTVGKMLNISADLGTVDQVAEGCLKQFIGGDRIFVDRKNKEPITIRPTAKLMAAWNERPRIRDRSRGIWRRLIVMPFRKQIDHRSAIKGMDSPQYWAHEAAGICNWALAGLDRLLAQDHFSTSAVCDDAVTSFRNESSPVSMYLTENWKAAPDSTVFVSEIYESFCKWAREAGYQTIPNATHFGREVAHTFPDIEKFRSSIAGRPNCYRGIARFDSESF